VKKSEGEKTTQKERSHLSFFNLLPYNSQTRQTIRASTKKATSTPTVYSRNLLTCLHSGTGHEFNYSENAKFTRFTKRRTNPRNRCSHTKLYLDDIVQLPRVSVFKLLT
jgi:hypothetical protein